MKAARVYLKPDGARYHDFGIDDSDTMQSVRYGISSSGGMEGAAVFIPADSIHHVVIYTPLVPVTTLTVFPGGKGA